MARFPLASNSDWELVNHEQDIRGWEARDANNNRLGEVTRMLMDTETEMVESIRLDTGRDFPTADLHIGEGVVYCDVEDVSNLPAVVKAEDGHGRIARRVVLTDPVFASYEPVFRSHFGNLLATTGWVYEYYRPGYRFGYTLASEGDNAARPYEDLEPSARADFTRRHGDTEYGGHREAIRFGFEHHRGRVLRGDA